MSYFNLYMHELEEIFFNSHKENFRGHQGSLLPSKYGIGTYSLFATEHFHFANSVMSLREDTQISSTNQESLFFIMIMHGSDFHIQDLDKGLDIDLNNKKVYLGFNAAGSSLSSLLLKNQKNNIFSFYLSKEQLLNYLIEFDAVSLIKKVEAIETTEFFHNVKLSINSNYIIQKLMYNPYNGTLKNIYVESLINELLISLLTDLCPTKTKKVLLSEGDKEILHKAKEILLNDLQNPPTIEKLAQLLPINQSKLTSGFRILFDRTIHQTLTEKRMEQAYENLKNLDMAIWEIAHEAGYTNVSNFINVFKQYYGKTPGQIRKNRHLY